MITRASRQLVFLPSTSIHTTALSRQRGVVLLVSLLFLIVLTLLGIGASRMVTSEERMSRYLREYNTAFQATEAALRDARDDIDGTAVGQAPAVSRVASSNAIFGVDCPFGLCRYDPSEVVQPWKTEAKWTNATPYGTYTLRSPLPKSGVVGIDAGGSKNVDEVAVARFDPTTSTSLVTGVWKQPVYLIEQIKDQRPGTNSVVIGLKTEPYIYRITARGYGADPNSRAMAQEVYVSATASAGF
jgi:type IV pilus assembly protein PilX